MEDYYIYIYIAKVFIKSLILLCVYFYRKRETTVRKWTFGREPETNVSRLSYVSMMVTMGLFVWWCLMPLSTIFQLYRGGQFYWWRKPGENHRLVASHWQTLSHTVVHLALIEIQTHNISGDRHWLHIGSCKSSYHTFTATMAPSYVWGPSPLVKGINNQNNHYPITDNV